MNPLYILFAIPFFLLMVCLEMFYSHIRRKKIYRFNDTVSNLLIGIGNQVCNLFFKAGLFGLYVWTFSNMALFHQPKTWWSLLLCVVAYDFLFYWAHRWGHEINIFWGAHLVHHSSEEYNLSVALRQSWFHNVLAFAIFLPLPLFGFHPLIFLPSAGIQTLYQFWIHTKLIGKLHPWVEFWINTPSHHRVHHGRNPKYTDKNHAGIFIIWDRMFGTFQEEEEEPEYGITTPLESWNPLWANIHYYVSLLSLSGKIRGWKNRFRLFMSRPGWRPAELGGYQPTPPLSEQKLEKYDANTSRHFSVYVFVQFIIVLLGLIGLMAHFTELGWPYRLMFFCLIVLSSMICGAILENKRWVLIAEYVRLSLALLSLNLLYYFHYFDWFIYMLIGSGISFVVFNLWFTLGWVIDRQAGEMEHA